MAAQLKHAPDVALTGLCASEAMVLVALTRAADSNALCPSNEDLARMIGAARPGSASWIIGKLEQRGLIDVYRWQRARMVTIVASGRSTRMVDPGERRERAMLCGKGYTRLRAEPVEPPMPEVVPLPRVTCFNCGATSLTPCAHLRRAGLV